MTQDAHESSELDLSSLLDLSTLPDDPLLLKQLLAQLLLLVRKETKRREEVERAIDALLKSLRRSKSLPDCPGQGWLFEDQAICEQVTGLNLPADLEATPPEAPSQEPPKSKGRPHGRRGPSADMETVEVVHDIPEELKALFAEGELRPLPDLVTYQYDYRPGKVIQVRHIQRKYLRREMTSHSESTQEEPVGATAELASSRVQANGMDDPLALSSEPAATALEDKESDAETCSARTTAMNSDPEELKRQLPRILLAEKKMVMSSCLAAPGLLAFVWLSKYGDHLPLYRQETITQRFGIHLPRSTLCQWMMELADTMKELYQVMIQEVRRSRVLHTDDTTVQRQDIESGQWSTARFWNYVGDEAYPLTVFQYTLTHERTHPATFLRDYRGYLQADAYNGYDGIYLESAGAIIEVGCWQHARKRFKAALASDIRAHVAMAFIKSLYAIEKKLRQSKQDEWATLSIDQRAERVQQIRQQETAPLLQSFGSWLRQMQGAVLPKSDLGEAIRYTLNQWDALQVFTTCGLLDPDNNEAERGHRGIAIGRKNWRMVGSDRGGEAAAIHFSFIASCKINQVEPFTYLVDVLGRLPNTPRDQLVELLPHRWKPTPDSPVAPPSPG
jgi:hypothetical protein